MRTICAWCRCVKSDDGTPSNFDSHGICIPCAVKHGYPVDDEIEAENDAEAESERALRAEARQADLDEEAWARRALDGAPRCVLEDLAEGSLLSVAARVAREMLIGGGSTPRGSHR